MCIEVGEAIMTKNEALYKYLKMDYVYFEVVRNQDYSVLSYSRVGWAFCVYGDTYRFKPAASLIYFDTKITERTILKLVKLL